MAKLIDGREVAETLKSKLLTLTETLAKETGVKPGLAILRVGEDPASQLYVHTKGISAKEIGFHFEEHAFPAWVAPAALESTIQELNQSSHIHGIILQLPLPTPLDKAYFLSLIDPQKDVDGLHPLNVGRLFQGSSGGFVPPTPLGCFLLLQTLYSSLEGRMVGIVGGSALVGKPMAMLMLQQGATVWVAHSKTVNLPALCETAEILIVAIGSPGFIQGEWIQSGATVLDVGINRLASGKIVGDVDFATAEKRAGAITPVPGGVGPMTVVSLLRNTLESAYRSVGWEFPAL